MSMKTPERILKLALFTSGIPGISPEIQKTAQKAMLYYIQHASPEDLAILVASLNADAVILGLRNFPADECLQALLKKTPDN